jgi:membrane-bound ClpP family serine protease
MLIEPWIWCVLLMLAGMSLIVLEVFIPSGGVIGFLSFLAVAGAVGLAFRHYGENAGFGLILLAMLAIPVLLFSAIKILPSTPIGKRLFLGNPTEEEVLPNDERLRVLRGLVGKSGHAKTKMLPSGAVIIDGRAYDAVSEGMPIEPGQPIRVIQVRTNRLIVRAEDESASDAEELSTEPQPTESTGPIESFGIDSDDDRAA